MLHLYNTALLPLRAVLAVWGAWCARDPNRQREWAERRAVAVPTVRPGGVWIHGASVGEARLVRLLAENLSERRPRLPLCVSCVTRAGRGMLPSPPGVDAAFFVPLDFPGLPGRLLDALSPSALVLVETEIWPNLLNEASSRGVRVALVNGRLSPERMGRYSRLHGLYRPLIAGIARIGAQSRRDAERFLELGARPETLAITGSMKYDLPAPIVDPPALRTRFALEAHRPVVVAGSTSAGEEPIVLEAYASVRSRYPRLFLILAPRHSERASEVGREAAKRGVRLHPLSRGENRLAGAADGLLVDTVGELPGLYPLAHGAFVGGSLVPVGGHNLIEPAAAGVPVIFGPHVHHVSEVAEALEQAGGALRVRDGNALAQAWTSLLEDHGLRERMARKAAELVSANRGALDKSVALVLSLLEGELAFQVAVP